MADVLIKLMGLSLLAGVTGCAIRDMFQRNNDAGLQQKIFSFFQRFKTTAKKTKWGYVFSESLMTSEEINLRKMIKYYYDEITTKLDAQLQQLQQQQQQSGIIDNLVLIDILSKYDVMRSRVELYLVRLKEILQAQKKYITDNIIAYFRDYTNVDATCSASVMAHYKSQNDELAQTLKKIDDDLEKLATHLNQFQFDISTAQYFNKVGLDSLLPIGSRLYSYSCFKPNSQPPFYQPSFYPDL